MTTSTISAITINPTPGVMGAVTVGALRGGQNYGGTVNLQGPSGGWTWFPAITASSNPAVLPVSTTNPWGGTGFGYTLIDSAGNEVIVDLPTGGGNPTYTDNVTNDSAVPTMAVYNAAALGSTNLTIQWKDENAATQTATLTLNVVTFQAVPVSIFTTNPTPVVVTPPKGLSLGVKLAIGASALAVGGVGVAVAAQRGVFAGLAGEARAAHAAMESVAHRFPRRHHRRG